MKKIFFLIIILLTGVIYLSPAVTAEQEYVIYGQLDYIPLKTYQLINYELTLPDDVKNFLSDKAQNELLHLAALYGGNRMENEYKILDNSRQQLEDTGIPIEVKEEKQDSINLYLTPEFHIDANYYEYNQEIKLEKTTNINLEYDLNNRTKIRAGIVTWEDDSESEIINDSSKIDRWKDSSTENNIPEGDFNIENKASSRLGISYKTSNQVTLMADYINNDNLENDYSTILGVAYNNDKGQLTYQYQVDFGEKKQTINGLQLDLKDLATINASYKLLDPDMLAGTKESEWDSVWDFGVGFNLNEESVLSLGYQIKNKQPEELDLDPKEEKESNIQAKLEIKF